MLDNFHSGPGRVLRCGADGLAGPIGLAFAHLVLHASDRPECVVHCVCSDVECCLVYWLSERLECVVQCVCSDVECCLAYWWSKGF